jgi:lipopolysaccharide export system permease protein
MTTIDRYLLRQFLQTFLICFCSLVGLIVVIDCFSNLEEFINHAKSHGGLLVVVGKYYGYRLLTYFDMMGGILPMLAATFTVTWFQRHNEMTAVEAAGISKGRVVQPLLVAVAIIVAFAAINRELFIPPFKNELAHNAQELDEQQGKPLEVRYDCETNVLFQRGWIVRENKELRDAEFKLPGRIGLEFRALAAATAAYQPAKGNIPQGYLLRGVKNLKLTEVPSVFLAEERPLLFTPHDQRWLNPDEAYLVSNIEFNQLENGAAFRRYSSTTQLMTGLHNAALGLGPDVRTTIHFRFVQPLLDFTLLMLGLPLILRRSNQNVFWAVGACVGVVAAFMMVTMGCQWLGSDMYLAPPLAAWLPLMIFVPTAMGLSQPLFE